MQECHGGAREGKEEKASLLAGEYRGGKEGKHVERKGKGRSRRMSREKKGRKKGDVGYYGKPKR